MKKTTQSKGSKWTARTLVVVRDANGKIIKATTRPEREPEKVYVTWSKRPLYI